MDRTWWKGKKHFGILLEIQNTSSSGDNNYKQASKQQQTLELNSFSVLCCDICVCLCVDLGNVNAWWASHTLWVYLYVAFVFVIFSLPLFWFLFYSLTMTAPIEAEISLCVRTQQVVHTQTHTDTLYGFDNTLWNYISWLLLLFLYHLNRFCICLVCSCERTRTIYRLNRLYVEFNAFTEIIKMDKPILYETKRNVC